MHRSGGSETRWEGQGWWEGQAGRARICTLHCCAFCSAHGSLNSLTMPVVTTHATHHLHELEFKPLVGHPLVVCVWSQIRDMELSHEHALSSAQEALDKVKRERNAMCLGLAALTQAAVSHRAMRMVHMQGTARSTLHCCIFMTSWRGGL
jgi:hypothetical protein